MAMRAHPSYPALSSYLPKYPRTAGAAYQIYNDLLLAQQWGGLEVVDLPACGRVGFRGRRHEAEGTSCVVPCSLAEMLSMAWVKEAFEGLENPTEVYLAITADDSSVVYYKLTAGIAKPPI